MTLPDADLAALRQRHDDCDVDYCAYRVEGFRRSDDCDFTALDAHVRALSAQLVEAREGEKALAGLLEDTRRARGRCDHKGIGLPGCWTCDPRLDAALSKAAS